MDICHSCLSEWHVAPMDIIICDACMHACMHACMYGVWGVHASRASELSVRRSTVKMMRVYICA